MAYFLYLLNSKFQDKFESIDWKYTATSHGKGVVDGIGGSAKSRIRAEVMGHREVVQTAKDFAIVAAKIMPNVTVVPIMQEQIDAESESIDWSSAIEIKGIQCVHSIINCNSELHFYIDSRSLKPAIVQRYSQDDPAEIKIIAGTFILARVAGKKRYKKFVCQVLSIIEGEDLTVSYLKKISSNTFSYVANAKQYELDRHDIVKILPTPVISNRLVIFSESVDANE